jgi:Holliday junction resolvase RusA-like endonuclease
LFELYQSDHNTHRRIEGMSKRKSRGSGKDANVELLVSNESMAACKGSTFDTPVNISVNHYRCRLCDPDGLSVKAAIDGLVHCGVLRDDSAKEISEIRHFQHKVSKPEDERTEITITEVSE